MAWFRLKGLNGAEGKINQNSKVVESDDSLRFNYLASVTLNHS